jgi:hypothetical protein
VRRRRSRGIGNISKIREGKCVYVYVYVYVFMYV